MERRRTRLGRDVDRRRVRAAAGRDAGTACGRLRRRRDAASDSVSRRIRLAVLAGGRSSEHEISLASAASVVAALDPERYDVGRSRSAATAAGHCLRATAVASSHRRRRGDAPGAGRLRPRDARSGRRRAPDPPRPVRRGRNRSGPLRARRRGYVGPGVLASSVCMDKDVFKTLMRGAAIPVANHVALRLGDPVTNPFGYPVFVKPANMGSSVGISKVRDESELEAAVALARRHDEKVMVEEFVPGMEIEVGVLGNLPSPVASLAGHVVANNADWYDYSSKYDDGGSELVVPPPGLRTTRSSAPVIWRSRVRRDVVRGHGARGLLRPRDRRRDPDERAEHDPGLHGDELLLGLFAATGIAYEELLDRLDRARARAPRAPARARVLSLPQRARALPHGADRAADPATRRP